MAKYHVAWTPGAGQLNDTFKIVWDGDEPNIPKIEFVVKEVADDSDGSGSPTTEVIRFEGEVKAKKLTVSKATPNPSLAKLNEEITIACGGKTQTGVKLPGVARENGMFELKVEIMVAGKKVAGADSTVAYVRYQAFSPRPAGVVGPVVAFITGTDGFNQAAERFWERHADTVITREGMSLAAIVDWLRTHKDRYGSFGEVNIITHGNERTIMIRLFDEPSDPRRLNLTYLNQRLKLNATPVVVDPAFAPPNGLGATSRVVFRACNAGNHPDLVAAIRKHVFGDVCPVYIPKYLQAYVNDGSAEFFYEQLRYYSPTVESAAAQETKMKAIFVARYPTASWTAERSTFTARTHPDQQFKLYLRPVPESDLYSSLATPTKKTNAEIDQIADGQWNADGYDKKDETFNSHFFDWGVAKRDQTLNPSDPSASQHWIEVSAGVATPAIRRLPNAGGTLTIGTDASSDLQLTGTGVAANHGELTLTGSFGFEFRAIDADVTLATTGLTQLVKKGLGFKGSLGNGPGYTFKFGSVTVTVRGERPITLGFDLVRHQYDLRRRLKNGSPYATASDEVPTVTNSAHYTKK